MLANWVIAHARAAASRVLGAAKAVVVNLETVVGGDASTDEPLFGQLGVVARPLPPQPHQGANGLKLEGECEVICIKNEDGLQPIAARDLRLNSRLLEPAAGDVFLAGYGGGYVGVRMATDSRSSAITLRATRLSSGGSDQGGHTLTLNPVAGASPAVQLAHIGGYSITITDAGNTEVRDQLIVGPELGPIQVALAAADYQVWVAAVTAMLNAIQATLAPFGGSGGTPVATIPNLPPLGSAPWMTIVPPAVLASSKLSAAP